RRLRIWPVVEQCHLDNRASQGTLPTYVLFPRCAKDQAGAALQRQVFPNPSEGHHDAVSHADQEKDVSRAPECPSDEDRQMKLAERSDGAFAPDRREIAEVAVTKAGGLGP